jgi:hypothetical protein
MSGLQAVTTTMQLNSLPDTVHPQAEHLQKPSSQRMMLEAASLFYTAAVTAQHQQTTHPVTSAVIHLHHARGQ